MRAEDRVRLRHMLDAAEEAVGFYTGKGSEDLAKARVLMLAIVKGIEIIGDAAAKVSQELQVPARVSLGPTSSVCVAG